MTHDDVRAHFPVLDRIAYLNAGTFGPLSLGTAAAVAAEHERGLHEGRVGLPAYQRASALREAARSAVGALVGAPADRLALTTSTTDGCNIVLSGLDLTADDEVVTTTDEHFGLLGPLAVSPARVVVVPPDPELILAAVTSRTRLLALSHVLWTTGAVLPVAELRAATGLPVLVDGAQSAGAIAVEAAALDFYTVSGQKWLCGPDATGALYVREPERLTVGLPSFLGQTSHGPDGAFEPKAGAARFDSGWHAPGALAGLVAAIGERPPWALEHAQAHAELLRTMLDPVVDVIRPDVASSLVSFRPPAGTAAAEVVERLRLADVAVRDLPGRKLVRASVGWWTNESDLERLVAGVRA